MTLTKAIELLEEEAEFEKEEENLTMVDALKLGIEAIKRIKECRLADHMIREDWLPGETKE